MSPKMTASVVYLLLFNDIAYSLVKVLLEMNGLPRLMKSHFEYCNSAIKCMKHYKYLLYSYYDCLQLHL